VITILTTLGCGMLPALRLSRPRLGKSLREGTRTAVASRQRVREGLVVAELALALVLLLGAGLLTRSFARLLQVDPGFRAPGLAVLQVFFGDRQTTREKRAEFFQQTVAKLRTLPGVVAAGAVSRMPFIEANITIRSPFLIEGRPYPPGQEPSTVLSVATPGYFDAMRIPLREGRWFDERDGAGTSPVVVINDVAARQYWPGASPVGRRVALRFEGRPLQAEIVGVVGSVRHERLDRPASAEAFVPHAQVPTGQMSYVLRTDGDPRGLIPAARERIWSVDPMQTFYRTATVSELMAKSVADRRFLMVLLSVFAALALLLAATGIYGLLSFVVAQRTQEIGVRRALGAGQAAILRLVLGQGMKLVLGGLAIGLAGFLALRGVLRGLLFDVSSVDPVAVASVLALLLAVALAACYLPARRATVVDPAVALRSE
jgi:predicted permease